MSLHGRSIAFCTVALLALVGTPAPLRAAEDGVTATLKALSKVYEGGCPVDVAFTGEITVHDPAVKTVRFQFVRSDGVGTPVANLEFPEPGSRPVSVSTPVGSEFVGWMGIRLMLPGGSPVIAKASFDVRCTDREPSWTPGFTVAENFRVTEECVPLDREALTVVERGGRARIAAGNRDLFDFDGVAEAQKALEVIRAYQATHACAGGAGFRYLLLAGGRSPAGPPPGVDAEEDVREFDPDALTVKKLPPGWAIVQGEEPLFSFGADDVGARRALAVIRRYRFDRACRFAGAQGPYWYLRK